MLNPGKTHVIVGTNATAALDLFRAIAANSVLLTHCLLIFGFGTRQIPDATGPLGVCCFFVLSGFLIMQSCMARSQQPGEHFNSYMIDRFARIFTAYVPALIFVVAANEIFTIGLQDTPDGSSRGWVGFAGNLLLLQNYPIFQAGHRWLGSTLYIHPYNAADPFWTIPIEFWIYVVFGVAFFGLFRRERLPIILTVVLGAIALPVVIWNAAGGGGNGLSLVWIIGAAAGYVWASIGHRSPHKYQIGRCVLVFACVTLIGRSFKIGWVFQDIGMALCITLIVVGTVSMVDGMRMLPGRLRGLCAFFASYSYSLYLVHNTVIVIMLQFLPRNMMTFLLALVLSHATAFVMYGLFERHYRYVGKWLKQQLPIAIVPPHVVPER